MSEVNINTRIVLCYHGCYQDVAERLIQGEPLRPSENQWDWLGNGVYFWEANPMRALEFIRYKKATTGTEANVAVVGAALSLTNCLDFSTSHAIRLLKFAYEEFKTIQLQRGKPLPRNLDISDDPFKLKKGRILDKAVIEHLCTVASDEESLTPFDAVRSVFTDGGEAFPGSGIMSKTHVQIAVRNLEIIHGVFHVDLEKLEDGRV